MHWNAAFPEGVSEESTCDVIDIDKSNYKLKFQNRKFEKVTWERHCDARGKYRKGVGSVSLLMAILQVLYGVGNHSVALLQLHKEFNGLAGQ